MFEKAGKPGWAAIVPIYNVIVVLKIVMTYIAFARNFGKGVGFGWGLAFLGLIFMPILAWGDAIYRPQG